MLETDSRAAIRRPNTRIRLYCPALSHCFVSIDPPIASKADLSSAKLLIHPNAAYRRRLATLIITLS